MSGEAAPRSPPGQAIRGQGRPIPLRERDARVPEAVHARTGGGGGFQPVRGLAAEARAEVLDVAPGQASVRGPGEVGGLFDEQPVPKLHVHRRWVQLGRAVEGGQLGHRAGSLVAENPGVGRLPHVAGRV